MQGVACELPWGLLLEGIPRRLRLERVCGMPCLRSLICRGAGKAPGTWNSCPPLQLPYSKRSNLQQAVPLLRCGGLPLTSRSSSSWCSLAYAFRLSVASPAAHSGRKACLMKRQKSCRGAGGAGKEVTRLQHCSQGASVAATKPQRPPLQLPSLCISSVDIWHTRVQPAGPARLPGNSQACRPRQRGSEP